MQLLRPGKLAGTCDMSPWGILVLPPCLLEDLTHLQLSSEGPHTQGPWWVTAETSNGGAETRVGFCPHARLPSEFGCSIRQVPQTSLGGEFIMG